MKKIALGLLGVVVIAGLWYWFGLKNAQESAPDLGTYAYECDEHVAFVMTPSSNLDTVEISPRGGSYPPASTLKKQVTNNGARYEGNGVVFVAHGEGVVLGEGDSAINCSPVASSTQAPFNFGD